MEGIFQKIQSDFNMRIVSCIKENMRRAIWLQTNSSKDQ